MKGWEENLLFFLLVLFSSFILSCGASKSTNKGQTTEGSRAIDDTVSRDRNGDVVTSTGFYAHCNSFNDSAEGLSGVTTTYVNPLQKNLYGSTSELN